MGCTEKVNTSCVAGQAVARKGNTGDFKISPSLSELIGVLAASAPQLQSLERHYPAWAPECPYSALPANMMGQLGQLTRLALDCQSVPVWTSQVCVGIVTPI